MKPIDAFLTQIQAVLQPTQIITDPSECAHYAQDWSAVLTPNSPATVLPETTLQVSKILSLANDLGIAVIPSGGRTGLSGGAVATQGEVVLSLTRMNFIRDLHLGALTVRVGAGAITQAVHDFCEPHSVTWPVDFASKGSSCVGGNIATNAGGVRVLRYGNTRNWILGLTAVTMDGTIHEFNGELEKNNTGYDLRQLMIGSEGTLAVVTEATLKLAPLPKSRAVFFFALENFSSVVELFAFARARIASLSAFECMDRPCLLKTMEHFQLKAPVNLGDASGAPGAHAAGSDSAETGAKAFVLMEVENAALDDCEVWLNDIFEAGLVLDGVMAQNEREAKELWHYREGIAEAVLAGHSVHQEDVSVPVARLAEFYSEIHSRYQRAFKMGEITSQNTSAPFTPIDSHASNHAQVYFFGHIGDGNLHIFIQGPRTDADESTRKKFLSDAKVSDLELFQVLKQYRGSISAEHGIGLLKRHAIHFSRSEPEIALMRGMKKVFDPKGLLNPGKVFE